MSWNTGERNWRVINTAIGMSLIGLSGIVYFVVEDIKEFNKLEGKSYSEKVESLILRDEQKKQVMKYVDKDSNGLSFCEDYKIKELMSVQDSSKSYSPSFEDWERAYNKILLEGGLLKNEK